jgi:hypothetical protein
MKVTMFEPLILVLEDSLGGRKQCYSVTIRAQMRAR